MISVLILTHQEERNLPRCLEALAWCDDIVVLDSFSTDATTDVARRYGARVLQRPFDSFAGQRNHALAHGGLRHEWVLHLDADEVVTPELRDEMLAVVGTTSRHAFWVTSKLIFRDRWIRHAGMYPTYQVRLGRRDQLHFTQVGHGQRETLPLEQIGRLANPFLHFSFSKGVAEWVEKHNRYSTAEALHTVHARRPGHRASISALFKGDAIARRRAAKVLVARIPGRAIFRFVYLYFLKLGFLDGAAGYAYCRLVSMYELMIELKIRELELEGGPP